MNNWFLLNIGDAMLAYEQQEHITKQLLAVYTAAGSPDDMAAFIRHESSNGLHCEVIIYFSPSSAAIAQTLKAQPCAKPSANSLSMLVGTPNSWQLLFPEHIH